MPPNHGGGRATLAARRRPLAYCCDPLHIESGGPPVIVAPEVGDWEGSMRHLLSMMIAFMALAAPAALGLCAPVPASDVMQ